MFGPKPDTLYPLKGYDKVLFLKPYIQTPNIFVGDYTYYDDRKNGPENFEHHNVLYNDDVTKSQLVIGKFCAIAAETRFLMNGDHKLDGFSTYPFPIFQNGWEKAFDIADFPSRGDLIVGNDVWFGYDSLIRGGVTVGDGAIIASRAVVVKDVPAYSIVAGNPAKVVKMRFDDQTIERLLKLSWWDWPIEKISRNLPEITGLDIDKMEEVASHE